MAASLRASKQGLEIVDRARTKKGWTKTEEAWWGLALSSQATLKRFLQGKRIKQEAFISLCQAVGIENWEEIAEENSIEQTNSLISWFSYDDNWVGREETIAQLSEKLRGTCRVLILTGITGIGKTALAERLAVELQGYWTKCCRVNFDDKERVTDFASVAAELLAGWHETVMPEERANPQQLLYRLVKRLREHRYLVLIDALEQILKGNEETGWSGFADEWWERFFEQLMTAESCQSRVILTSQVKSRQLEEIGFGNYPQTIEYFQQGLTIYREIGDRNGEGTALGNLGLAYHCLGDYFPAIEYNQQSLTIAREIGDRDLDRFALGNLGNIYHSLGDYRQALQYLQQSLTIAREISNRYSEGRLLGNLGNIYHSLGDYRQAIEYQQQSLSIAREINDRNGEGSALGNLGETLFKLEQYSESIENLQVALEILKKIGDRSSEAEVLKNFAQLYQKFGDLERAIEYCNQALAIATELGIPLAKKCHELKEKLLSGE